MKFDRRLLLKAAAGAPLLGTLASRVARADGARPPKRIVFWFQPNGVAHKYYHPRSDSTETNWGYDAMGDMHTLLPLNPFKDITLHFDSSDRLASMALTGADEWKRWTDNTKLPFGLTDLAGCTGPNPLKPPAMNGNPTRELTIGHECPISLMTGRFPSGTVVTAADGTQAVEFHSVGDSIDIALGKALGNDTRIRSAQLGANSYAGFTISYDNGARQPIIDDPRLSFQTLFAGIPNVPGIDPQAAAELKKMSRRKASFEAAYARFGALKSSMTSPDQQRLQQHFDAYKNVETRLTQAPNLSNLECHSPTAPASNLNLDDPFTFPQRVQTMIEQMTLALACDVTRVMTVSWTTAATNQVFSFLPGFSTSSGAGGAPAPDGHHPLSHDSYNGTEEPSTQSQLDSYEKKRRIERWYAEQLAAFLTALKNVKEADGSTLLDNTAVVVVNELNHSGAHNNSNMPIRVYGSLQGALRTGRYLTLPTTPLNSLYVSLANAMGLPWTTFGETSFAWRSIGNPTGWQPADFTARTGPIPGLTV